MSRSLNASVFVLASAALLSMAGMAVAQTKSAAADAPRYGLGTRSDAAEIAGWDIDVRPDSRVRPGTGTVAQGQVCGTRKCAYCHGTFGESNEVLHANRRRHHGGRHQDRARAALARTGRHAHRRYQAERRSPRSGTTSTARCRGTRRSRLRRDEVYAITAYMLHLGDIVPADFVLNDRNIAEVQTPANRNGMSTDHGMYWDKGKPDVRATACMKDCANEGRSPRRCPSTPATRTATSPSRSGRSGRRAGIDTTRRDVEHAATRHRRRRCVAARRGRSAKRLVTRNACSRHATAIGRQGSSGPGLHRSRRRSTRARRRRGLPGREDQAGGARRLGLDPDAAAPGPEGRGRARDREVDRGASK